MLEQVLGLLGKGILYNCVIPNLGETFGEVSIYFVVIQGIYLAVSNRILVSRYGCRFLR